MVANKAALVAVVAALAQQAQAFNSHRHLHNTNLEKKAIEVDWVTVWETVYATPGQEATGFAMNAQPSPTSTSTPTPVRPTTTSTSTSTLSTSTSTSTSTPPPPPPPTTSSEEPPPPAPTTLATVAKAPADDTSSSGNALGINLSLPDILNPDPTTSTPAETPTPSPDSGSGSGSGSSVGFSSKRGMAYNDATLANLFGKTCTACSWAWNWGSSCPDLQDGVSFVPMLWGPTEDHTGTWDSDAEEALSKGSKAMFSFNECDNAGQANLSPEQAAADHAKYMNKYGGRALISAPSITNSGSPGQGVDWLKSFMQACDSQSGGCQVDFCSVHWYSGAQYADTLFDLLEQAHKTCNNKPIWLTEFAPTGSDDEISSFLQEVIPKLDKLDYLEAYSYFMVSVGSLMSSITGLGSYGEVYATFSG